MRPLHGASSTPSSTTSERKRTCPYPTGRSSYSGNASNCVEVAAPTADAALIRESDDPSGNSQRQLRRA
ncbi:DUF397 domain-containing protein [Streptomyces monomycini]|uniref:DUF397 domain-containing protein n=1 Tax=Streptomyces monomycini TaxID=371720 RepID=UPI000D12D38F|nr:DUF397 domain-containing protein [Streptomyces monomycini]